MSVRAVNKSKRERCGDLSPNERRSRAVRAYSALTKMYPLPFNAELGHHIRDPYRVLIATILSQRTRDEVTHAVAERLFKRYGRVEALAEADVREVEALIRPVGFYRNKAPKIVSAAKAIVEDYGGHVPDNIDTLLKLPGVGRKTANCVLVYGYGIPAIAVDTHVHRLMNMWCIVSTKNPEETEEELMKILPKDMWLRINDLLVTFGQRICKPQRHYCDRCPKDISSWCPEYRESK